MEAAAQGQDNPRPSEVTAVTHLSQGRVLAILKDGRVVQGVMAGPGAIEWTDLDPVPGTPAEAGGWGG